MEKASAEHVEIMFLYERCMQGDCWKSLEEVDQGLACISGQLAKRNTLKKHITIYVKGLGWHDYHTTWSLNGTLRPIECLAEHLKFIIIDSQANNRRIERPKISMPMRKALPQLGEVTVDVRAKFEEDNDAMNDMQLKCNETRVRLINKGIRDEMRLRQPSYAPDLKQGMKIQYAFRHADEESPDDEIIEWCTGTVTIVGNGNNLRNPGKGPRHYRKGGGTEVQWDADISKGDEISFSIVKIKKTLFNCYEEFSWRLFFDIAWNSKALQIACKESEKINDEELSQEN